MAAATVCDDWPMVNPNFSMIIWCIVTERNIFYNNLFPLVFVSIIKQVRRSFALTQTKTRSVNIDWKHKGVVNQFVLLTSVYFSSFSHFIKSTIDLDFMYYYRSFRIELCKVFCFAILYNKKKMNCNRRTCTHTTITFTRRKKPACSQ
jgi:hypothetical protein